MINKDKKLDEAARARFESLRGIPPRDPQKAAQRRALYLSQVKSQQKFSQPVSDELGNRLNMRTALVQKLNIANRRFSMSAVLSTIMVIAALLFGGTGVTAYAAQGSQPDEMLYPVKTLTEDVQLRLASEPDTQFQLALQFAAQRLLEAGTMVQNGEAVPDAVATRLQQHLNQATQLAFGMDDAEMQQALSQIRNTIQAQEQILAGNGAVPEDATLARIRETLQAQNQACQTGLSDPLMFRHYMQQQTQEQQSSEQGANAETGDSPKSEPVQNGAGVGSGQGSGAGSGSGSDLSNDTSMSTPTHSPGGNSGGNGGSGGSGGGGGKKP